MKVCIYVELENLLDTSGISVAAQNQKKAIKKINCEKKDNPKITMNPWDEYDLLHLNTIGPLSLFHLKKAKMRGKKVITHAHTTSEDFKGSFMFSDQISKPLKKYLSYFYDKGDGLLCPSEYTRRKLLDYGIKNKPIVVSNGVDIDKFKHDGELRKKYREKFDLDGLTVFAVGTPFERKGVETFVKVARLMPELEFVWFGPLRKSLQKRKIKSLVRNSPENVKFTGKVENIVGAYSAGDIFFFPSYIENQGIVVLEAASCEKPMVLRDIPAFNYCEHKGECLKGKKRDEFVDLIRMIVENPDFRGEISSNAKKMAKKHSLKNTGKRLSEIYKEVYLDK